MEISRVPTGKYITLLVVNHFMTLWDPYLQAHLLIVLMFLEKLTHFGTHGYSRVPSHNE